MKRKERTIESRPHEHTEVILMPRYGVKNVISRKITISLPYVKSIDDAAEPKSGA